MWFDVGEIGEASADGKTLSWAEPGLDETGVVLPYGEVAGELKVLGGRMRTTVHD